MLFIWCDDCSASVVEGLGIVRRKYFKLSITTVDNVEEYCFNMYNFRIQHSFEASSGQDLAIDFFPIKA